VRSSFRSNSKVLELVLRKYQNLISQDFKTFQSHFEGFRELQDQLQFAHMLNNYQEVEQTLTVYSLSPIKLNDQQHKFDSLVVLDSKAKLVTQTGTMNLDTIAWKSLLKVNAELESSGLEYRKDLNRFHLFRVFEVEGQGRHQLSALLGIDPILQRLSELKLELLQYELPEAKVALASGTEAWKLDSDWQVPAFSMREKLMEESDNNLVSQVIVLLPGMRSLLVCELPQSIIYERIIRTVLVLAIYTVSLWVLLVLILSFLLNHLVIRPLQIVKNQSDRMAKGELSQRIEFQGQDEVASLAHSFNAMAQNIEQAQIRLREFNQNLSELVTVKTSAIQNLLDNTGQGFLSFGSNFLVHGEHSRMCLSIFEKSQIEGCHISELLYPDDDKSRTEFEDWIQHVFEPKLHLKFIVDLAPSRVELHSNIYSMDYRFLESENMNVKERQVLLILTDVTEEIELKKVVEQEQSFLRMVMQTLEHPQEFQRLRHGIAKLKTHSLLKLSKTSGDLQEYTSNFLFQLHGLKGNAASFEMLELSSLIHELEEIVKMGFDQGTIRKSLTQIDDEFHVVVRKLSRYIPVSQEQLLSINIPADKFKSLLETARSLDKQLASQLQEFQLKSIARLLGTLQLEAEGLCLRRNKLLQNIELIGRTDILVHPESFSFLLEVLEHLLRNAIDHGIEEPGERQELGKSAHGKIRIEIYQEEKDLRICFCDDGRGFHLEKVREIVLEKGLDAPSSTGTNELLEFTFAEGMSTALKTDEVSGRGLGLSAVRHLLTQNRGTVSVETNEGEGSCFTILLSEFFTYSKDPSKLFSVQETEN